MMPAHTAQISKMPCQISNELVRAAKRLGSQKIHPAKITANTNRGASPNAHATMTQWLIAAPCRDNSARMSANPAVDPTTINRLYGRSKGKPLRAGQQALVDELLPQIAVPLDGDVTATRLFGDDRPLHFERCTYCYFG